MAKMLPDSRMPRRLPSVISRMQATPMGTVSGSKVGSAEVIWATADEVDTATVRM